LLYVGARLFGVVRRGPVEYLVMGRTLALPSFVASLVSTWYGGVLGVGEYSYRYGISNWIVFGVPYYIGAALFAIFFARRARRSQLLSVPDQLDSTYGRPAALMGAGIIQVLSSPAPYVLMLGILIQMIFGWQLLPAVLIGTFFSTVYSFRGGMRSVVNADNVQFVLMYLGFLIALPLVFTRYGGLAFLHDRLPPTHFVWHGGNSPQYIFVWYFIALQTLVEPAFYQRCFAAKDEKTAQIGVVISIGFWMLFDFLTTFTGMYARALMPTLQNATASYPALAIGFLPPVVQGIFYLGLLATVMSTVDGYTFIGGVNFGRDLVWRMRREPDESRVNLYSQIGFLVTAVLAVILALFFRSAVDLWHDVGSVGVPALLVALGSSYHTKLQMRPRAAAWCIAVSGAVALGWLLSRSPAGKYPLSIEPIYMGLAVSVAIWVGDRLTRK
jgi:SSS family solute:Na+ symporter